MAMTSLQWPDYLILAAFLVISLGIGFYHSVTGGRQRTTQEFIMANRKLGILPTAISMFVSFQSAIMILGLTAEMYQYGIQYLIWIPVGFACAIVTTERLVVPWMYPLKLTSINDYLEQRFQSKAVRILGSANAILAANLYMGVAMYAPSAALQAATGLPVTVSIPLMAIVSVAYTALGGMRAVIWTDVFQCATLLGGVLAIMIKGLVVVGGYSQVVDICTREGRMEFANWSPDPSIRHTVWGMVIGWTFTWTLIYGFNQSAFQRYAATETLKKARIVLLLNIPAIALLTFIVCFTGLTVFAYYSQEGCDPFVNGDISSHNQLLSLFVATIFSNAQGFSGLFLATLYGGALSSVSSSLSGAAANCWDDILKWKLDGMKEHRKALLNKVLVIIFGAIATTIAFLAAVVPGTITQVSMTFSSMVNGPMLGMFIIGGISKHANYKGALVGGMVGLCISCWLVVGSFTINARHPTLPPTSVDGCPGNNVTTLLLNANASRWVAEDSIGMLDSMTSSTDAFYSHGVNSTISIRSKLLVSELSGIQWFYGISYLWYTMFGTINTVIIAMATSFIFRDRDAEAKVDERLLIPFRQVLSWSGTSSKSTTTNSDEHCDAKETDINYEIAEKQRLFPGTDETAFDLERSASKPS